MRKAGFNILFIFISFVFMVNVSFAQLSDNSYPASFLTNTKRYAVVPTEMLDSVRVEEQIAVDKENGIPNRYGIVQKTNVDIRKEGVKTVSGDVIIWRYEFQCPDAVSLSVFFDSYNLPENAAVYVYSADKKQLRGGFTSSNNKVSGKLAVAEIKGTSLIVEYDEPRDVDFKGELIVGYVIKAYASVKSTTKSRIPVNCPEGDDWQTEKHAVCRIIFTEGMYSYYCSGALLNNVRADGTPYFLTANHCIHSNSVAQTMVAYFNYENSTCSSNDASENQSLSGAELKATNSYSDFTLLELLETPPEEYKPYFAGWNASDDQPASGTSIHHPNGEYKCIAIDNDAPVNYAYYIQWTGEGDQAVNTTEPETHWKVMYDKGTDEGGSSGCPLFDQDHRVIGQLHGGGDGESYFGRFSVSWNYGAADSTQLKCWLDPDETNTLRIDGENFQPPAAAFSVDATEACLNTSVFFTDESTHNPTEWSWIFDPETVDYVNGTDENSQNPEVAFTQPGTYSVTLIVRNANGVDTLAKENFVRVLEELDVSFCDVQNELTVCRGELDDYLMLADGAKTYSFEVSDSDYFNLSTNSDSLFLTLKDETGSKGSFDTYVKVTGRHVTCSDTDSVLLHVIQQSNDDMVNAIPLNLGRNAYYSNECGTVEDNEPSPSSVTLNNSIWFKFQGPSSGYISIEVDGIDAEIALYEADSYAEVSNGDLLASAYGTKATIEKQKIVPSQTYWLQVDGNNGDSDDDISVLLKTNSVKLYPNPSNGEVTLVLATEEDGNVAVDVFSNTGQIVYSKTYSVSYNLNRVTMNLSNLPVGVYLLRVRSKNAKISKKIVITS